jgi:hypothetical protein
MPCPLPRACACGAGYSPSSSCGAAEITGGTIYAANILAMLQMSVVRGARSMRPDHAQHTAHSLQARAFRMHRAPPLAPCPPAHVRPVLPRSSLLAPTRLQVLAHADLKVTVLDGWQVAWYYLTSWRFWVDVVSIVPYIHLVGLPPHTCSTLLSATPMLAWAAPACALGRSRGAGGG